MKPAFEYGIAIVAISAFLFGLLRVMRQACRKYKFEHKTYEPEHPYDKDNSY